MKKLQQGSTIKDCQFYGVKFDESAVKSVNIHPPCAKQASPTA